MNTPTTIYSGRCSFQTVFWLGHENSAHASSCFSTESILNSFSQLFGLSICLSCDNIKRTCTTRQYSITHTHTHTHTQYIQHNAHHKHSTVLAGLAVPLKNRSPILFLDADSDTMLVRAFILLLFHVSILQLIQVSYSFW